MPKMEFAVCRGTNRNVCADCAERVAQAGVSLFAWEKNAGGGGARDCDVRAGNCGAGRGWNLEG